MREVAIVSPVRTAVGSFGGGLKDISAADLGATVIKAVLERTGLEPDKIDEVILGHGYPSGEEPALGRLCALKAGLPIEVPGYQLDRRCSSGLQSILNACMMVQTGNADVVLAGGVESMSRVEFYTTDMRWGSRLGSVTLHDRLTRARATASPTASPSRPSTTTGSAPSPRSRPAFAGLLVVAVTWWPWATSADTRGRPTAPLAPATKTRMSAPSARSPADRPALSDEARPRPVTPRRHARGDSRRVTAAGHLWQRPDARASGCAARLMCII